MTLSATAFARHFRAYIVLAWTIPPVFGLSFLLFIRMFSPAQMLGILTSPLEPAFCIGTLLFALWYFARFIRPVIDAIANPRADKVATALARMRRFPLDFWGVFLGYLLLAPASVILSAERYVAFEPQTVDWFRIHLVALIVSIIVGLPIFFRILDLFGRALNGAPLKSPHLTIRTKVFLIGALVPLLIDTMLVQYYWTRTGYFTAETFFMWLLLELLAIAGSLIFVHSFGQSLGPLRRVIGTGVLAATPDFSTLRAQSTDELGVLAEDFRALMEKLTESEANLRSLAEHANDGILVHLNGKHVFANQRLAMMLGYRVEELLQTTIKDLVYPDEQDMASERYERRLGGAAVPNRYETVFVTKSGAGIPVEISSAISTWMGQPAELAFVRDITERKQTEAHMLQLSSAVEQTADSVIITDRNGIIQYVNQAFERTTKFSSAEAIGKTPSLIKSDQHDAAFYQRLWDTIMRGETFFEVFANRRKDGTLYYEGKTITPLKDRQGRISHFVSTGRDITEQRQAMEALRESEERFRSLTELSSDWYWEQDTNFRFTVITSNQESTERFPAEETIGHPRWELPYLEVLPGVWEEHKRTLAEHRPFRDLVLKRRDMHGRIHYSSISGKPAFNAEGHFRGYHGIGRDITGRMQAMETLRASEASLTQAQRIAHLGNWHRNIITSELHWSDEVYRIFGLTPQQPSITFERFLNLVHPDDRQSVMEAVNKAINDKQPYSTDYRIIRPDGTERIVHAQAEIICIDDDKADHIVGTIQDITEYRLAQDRLNYLAHHDTLTNLPNRVLLQDRLHQATLEADRHERLVAVMFLDLDRFKIINDTLGHETGDALLKAVAERLKTCMRAGDTISRLGGDEFTVILANVAHVDDVARVAQKIIDTFTPQFNIAGRELFISASIGITLYPFDDNNLENLLRNADAAMYHAKEIGRNTFQFYTAELNRRTAKHLTLETALRHALERNELLLHYQPQVNLKTGRIIGAEALLRWQHPEMGLIPPLDFIPLAEETGLIITIGEWVLRTACRQAQAWHRAGFPRFQVAVNLSGRQLQHRDLAKVVKQVLKESGLDPRQLDLELTESLLMHNTGETLIAMEELHKLGVAFSMDDFGTGYSSLSYLKRFPIDTLKIDQSFVRGIPTDPDDAAIAQAIIAMAHSLGIKVIAEGVETANQLAFMRTHQCDGVQGYYFSKPITAEEVTKLLLNDRHLTVCRSLKTDKRAGAKSANKITRAAETRKSLKMVGRGGVEPPTR